jgi:hypothetical protein
MRMLGGAAFVLSALLIVVWIVLIVRVEPTSDPNAVLDYIILTVWLFAALGLLGIVALVVTALRWAHGRFRGRTGGRGAGEQIAKPS